MEEARTGRRGQGKSSVLAKLPVVWAMEQVLELCYYRVSREGWTEAEAGGGQLGTDPSLLPPWPVHCTSGICTTLRQLKVSCLVSFL